MLVSGGIAIAYTRSTAYLALVLIAAKVLFELSGYVDRCAEKFEDK